MTDASLLNQSLSSGRPESWASAGEQSSRKVRTIRIVAPAFKLLAGVTVSLYFCRCGSLEIQSLIRERRRSALTALTCGERGASVPRPCRYRLSRLACLGQPHLEKPRPNSGRGKVMGEQRGGAAETVISDSGITAAEKSNPEGWLPQCEPDKADTYGYNARAGVDQYSATLRGMQFLAGTRKAQQQ